MSVKQILIFDSGVGGLSIFEEIRKKNSKLSCYYLSDNAYFPYGELTKEVLTQRLLCLLTDFTKKHPVDLIVIACNTASTIALKTLREHFSIPIVGVVPAIKPACQLTKNNIIGLIATPATITREYTSLLIDEFATKKQVLTLASTALVKLAERKLSALPIDNMMLQKQLSDIFKEWLMLARRPDTIVLGCTHFPLLKADIELCFGGNIQLVDSGGAIAKRVQKLLPVQCSIGMPQHHAFYTQKNKQQCALEHAFLIRHFSSFSLFLPLEME
ncbi:glutamate racemase [Psychromonas sp. CNPT3]|uniref:glutamate racemase n=1 Tax=Psychromonas sp. CNPT3 TaxID=314282 RepID=UPI00006E8AB7|nr:glutamate racemase [Psychromonas sp. CNPT3]AGH80518.1 glutamate racemase [Psychromonas sp. CNPT3]